MTDLVKERFHTPLIKHIFVIFLYIILTVFLTYPLLFLPAKALLGPLEDNTQHVWTPWQTKQALTTKGEGIYHTDYIFYPRGASLLVHATHPLNNLIVLFFHLFFTLEYSYNLTIFLSFILNSIAAYILCYYFTKDSVASFIGGLIFGFSPYHFARALHHSYYVSSYLFPLLFLLFFKLKDKPNIKKALLLALLIILTPFLIDYYYLIFSLAFLFFGLCYCWITEKKKINRAFLKSFFIAISIALIALSPLIISIFFEIERSHYQKPHGMNRFVLDTFSFFTPPAFHPLWGRYTEKIYQNFSGNPWEATGYLGFTIIFLSILGILKWKGKKEDKSFFIWFIIITIILSLGASLHILGHHKLPLDNPLLSTLKTKEILNRLGYHRDFIGLPLPYFLIGKIPILNMAIRAPGRWVVLTYLCLSVAAAFGLQALCQANKRRKKIFLATLFFGLIVFEYLAIPLEYSAPPVSPFYYEIQHNRAHFALFDVPFKGQMTMDYWQYNYYLYLQTIHRKPLVIGRIARVSDEMYQFLVSSGLADFARLRGLKNLNINIMKKEKIKFIILHKKFIKQPSIRAKYINYLNAQLQIYYSDENINVYKIY
jgi:hypothetical protein